ncbi:CDP-diacylglycerol--serine O-phosphatidyltransferase [Methylogaea oryzae]|uniref:CDP-diacylglycerol--serine O-phosphatidyltransferase n=1 Tax=Methylogaea oryzae TaxID=1295382 RepID=A0A8D4VS91_9GAMM|nr:CDP-diacylglycerol--serine O-phosphatidyltransferase [Methylogaea oryzae]BBL71637.1 CDP-diacylglycerol--serine O-phosphatidyltransferase [Methylogaea oryzae]
MEEPNSSKRRRRSGIYLLPNLMTTGALFSGFYAITAAISGHFELAVIAIFAAMVLDGLDGRVARLTNTQSEFGAQYDSMSDLVSFGAAPALVMFVWSLSTLGKLGWVAAFVHCAGAALRLARFNTQLGTADKRYFQGLPSPAAAAVLAGYVWVGVVYDFQGASVSMVSLVLTVLTGLLMVSNVRYYSFKEVDWKGKVPFVVIIVVMLGFAVVLAQPSLMLFLIFLGYAVSGPALTLSMLRKWRQERKS